MSEVAAKIPTDESDWQAIDIYLFSNGQQYSPPRKYHLKSAELNWWESTLNYLARSHYGSFHSTIELYTLDGIKIEGPLQLIDGNPYVAVVPPDAFIPSGYEKYLIKASRSWEKRQAKRTSIVNNHILEIRTGSEHNLLANLSQEVTEEAENILSRNECPPELHAKEVADRTSIQIGDDHSILYVCTTTELTTIKTPDDNFAVDSALVKPQRSSTPKSDRSEVQSLPKSIITPKSPNTRNERRRSSGQHTAFVNTAQQKKNADSKIKEALYRRPLTKIPVKINERVNGLAVKAKNVTKYPLRRAPLPPPPAPTYQKATTPNDKSHGMGSAPTQNLIYDKEIIVISADNNLYKSTESESSAVQLDAVQAQMVDAVISCIAPETGFDEGVQTCTEQFTGEVNTVKVDYPTSKILVVPTTLAPQSNVMSCNIPLEDNYVAVINKGDAVKLNLNIELQNGKIQSESRSKEVRKDTSLSNIVKRRKLPSNHKEDTIAETKSLQSIISGINDGYTKVVVVQCGCCGNHTSVPRMDTMPVYKDENGLFILMPSPQGNPGQTCSCSPNHENAQPDKKPMTELFFGDLMKPKSASVYPCVTRDVGMMMSVMDADLRSRFQDAQTNVCGTTYTVTRQVCINEDQCNSENCCGTPSQVIETTEVIVSKSSPPRGLPSGSVESFTQTEWCSVLLEARLHDDGHYSFHLPPLDVLRYYSI